MRPYDHPLRTVLHEEVHARPPVALWPRDRILNQAFLLKGTDRQQQLDWINAISQQTKQTIDPNHGQTFRIIELRTAPQRIIIKWELHGEFSSISAIVQQKDLIAEAPIKTRPAIENEVNELLGKLSIKPMHEAGGLRISAIDIAFEDRALFSAADEVAHLFSGNTLIGSTILTNKKAQDRKSTRLNSSHNRSFIFRKYFDWQHHLDQSKSPTLDRSTNQSRWLHFLFGASRWHGLSSSWPSCSPHQRS